MNILVCSPLPRYACILVFFLEDRCYQCNSIIHGAEVGLVWDGLGAASFTEFLFKNLRRSELPSRAERRWSESGWWLSLGMVINTHPLFRFTEVY